MSMALACVMLATTVPMLAADLNLFEMVSSIDEEMTLSEEQITVITDYDYDWWYAGGNSNVVPFKAGDELTITLDDSYSDYLEFRGSFTIVTLAESATAGSVTEADTNWLVVFSYIAEHDEFFCCRKCNFGACSK